MQFFTKMFAATFLATPVVEVEERQLSGLPSFVCLTGALSGVLPSGVSIVECSSDETCTALDIPIVGSLLPIGTCEAVSSALDMLVLIAKAMWSYQVDRL